MKSNREILRFALPAIFENFLQMFVGLSDTFLVTHISLAAVAAVSLANNVIAVYQAIFIALGAITSSLFARKLAQKDQTQQEILNSAAKLTLILGVILGLFSLILGRPLVILFGAREQVAELSFLYLALVGGTILLLGAMTVLGSILRAQGDTKTPMWASLFINVLNVLVAAGFIFGLHWGVAGAGLATIIARLFGVLWLWQKIKATRPNRHFLTDKINPELIKLSLPAAGERLSMRLGDLLIMAIVISFGANVFAGNAIGESITQFNYMPIFGMATVTVVLIAQEFGQQNWANIQSYLRRIFWLSSVLMGAVGSMILLFSSLLNRLFTHNAQAASASTVVIVFSVLATFFVAGANLYTAAFQGIGDARPPFYATTFGMLVIRSSLGFVFGHLLKMGLAGVWVGVLIDNAFRFGFLKWRFKKALAAKND